jgi:multiple sugar transport system permease protein
MYEAYKSGFTYGEMGRALTIVMVLLALVMVAVVAQFSLFQRERN